MRYFKLIGIMFVSSLTFADQCQIVSPLPLPITISGCTYSGNLPGNSTSYIQNSLSPTTTTQMFSVQTATITNSLTNSSMAGSGTQCVQVDNTGLFSGTGATCGSGTGGGGGASTLAINRNAVQITSPTVAINFLGPPFIVTPIAGATTAQISLDGSSVTMQGPITAGTLGALTTSSATATYLQLSSAAVTYLNQINGAATYLTIVNGAATYLTLSSATATYLQQSSATATYLQLSSATANYFQNTSIIPIANGGTGTASPSLIAGTNITSITGSWPNQTINAATQSGGSGGTSSLAVGYGTTSGYKVQSSSPTGAINFDQSQFLTSLQGSATGFITISYSTDSIGGNYTAVSTDTVVEANCGSACTVTLPTAVGISGKRYNIKIIGLGVATIGTTSSQTIDGSTTITPNPNQWVDIEVQSNGSNWDIL